MVTRCHAARAELLALARRLEEAYHWVSALEVTDIILEHTLMGEKMIEYRKHSESYAKW
ncbi:MAG: hypothetical protein H6669_15385 [Ardenticatenaceae bacterium]|nr:hypothetical protein [Ardenticatenaceae bacterium]